MIYYKFTDVSEYLKDKKTYFQLKVPIQENVACIFRLEKKQSEAWNTTLDFICLWSTAFKISKSLRL